MINSNNALGFAVKNKVSGLEMLKTDRNAVKQTFDIDREDNVNDGFEMLAKRLANTAAFVFAAIKNDFRRGENADMLNGIRIKRLREGKKQDIAWLKETENAFLQVNGKELNNRPVTFKQALHGMTKKEASKVLDIEFNEQKGYPTLKRMTNEKWLVESAKDKGKMFSDFLEAMEHFVSLGGKIETSKGE